MSDPEPYDVNFCFPVPSVLENERVKLVPFIPSIHTSAFFPSFQQYPQLTKYFIHGPLLTLAVFEEWVESERRDPTKLLFAVFDKTRRSPMPHEVQGQRLLGDDSTASRGSDGAPAGTIGLLSASPQNLSVEIGRVKIFPPYQRTHVASNAVGLLLQYTLNTPIPPTGMNGEAHSCGISGLGLRRVTWVSHPLNEPSIRLARRLGFKLEATLRWDRALPPGKEDASNGHGIRCGDPKRDWTGWDTVLLSICWDDWELDGGRERVEEDMRRVR